MRIRGFVVSALLAVAVAAQDKPVRVHIIGASVSGGFRDGPMWGAKEPGDSVTLHQVLKRWADGEARVTSHNTVDMTAFFLNPIAIGKKQLTQLKRAKPDIVVAIDFPFWFAYGAVMGEDEAAARSQALTNGLEMLAEIDAPILIGDLPNMAGAAQRMLRLSWIPSAELLAELNKQLREWAKKHDNVTVIDLAVIVHQMRSEGIVLPLAEGPLKVPKLALQQEDRLHATRLGMAVLGHKIQGNLASLFPQEHPLWGQRWTLEQFVEAVAAEDELELLVERAAAAGKGK